MTDEPLHMPPPVPGRRVTVPMPEPEVVERTEVELIGGPAHGRKMMVRIDRKRIEVPYTPSADAPEVPEDGSRPEPVEVTAFTLVYLRTSEGAPTAAYHDLELDG